MVPSYLQSGGSTSKFGPPLRHLVSLMSVTAALGAPALLSKSEAMTRTSLRAALGTCSHAAPLCKPSRAPFGSVSGRRRAAHPIRCSSHYCPEAKLGRTADAVDILGLLLCRKDSLRLPESQSRSVPWNAQLPKRHESGTHSAEKAEAALQNTSSLTLGQRTRVSSEEGFIFGSKGYVAGIPTSPSSTECGQRLRACLKHRCFPASLCCLAWVPTLGKHKVCIRRLGN